MPVAMFTFRTVSHEVPNEAEVADLAVTGSTNILQVELVFPALPVSFGASAKLSPATEASLVLLELFLQLFPGAAFLVFRLLGLLAFAVDGGLLSRNTLITERLFGMTFG